MRRLLHYLKGYEKETVLAPLFKMLEACFELLVPLVVATIVDTGIQNQDVVQIWRQGGLLVLLAAVAFGVYWVAGGKNNGGAAAETKTYTYVVEGRQVLNETANFPVEGGKVFDSTSSAYLGTVKSCWTEPFREVNFNRTTNKYEMLPVPGYCNIYVEIEGSGTETDQDITVEGNVVKVGKEQNVKGKGYAFKGYIVEVRDGE